MRKTLRLLIEATLIFTLCLAPLRAGVDVKASASETDKRDIYGVWWRGGDDAAAMKKAHPWVKGVFVAFKWSNLEPANNKFDWNYFDRTLATYANAGLYVQFMVWVGPDSPDWIYTNGVPLVRTSVTLNPHGVPHKWKQYPFYLNDSYKKFYHRMIREVANHLDTLPASVREKIICIQTAEGTTGDEGGYKGEPLDAKYELPEDEWRAFKFETWRLFDSLYRTKQPVIHLLINSGNGGQYNEWLLKNLPDVWRKAGNPGHGYQLNEEAKMMRFFDPLINRPNSNGQFVRARSEMDETFKGWFQEAPVWNMYWLNLWGLHFGLDIFQHETEPLEDKRFDEGFIFYEKYGGRKDPATSPGAFCALRDGLDAADTKRFPADKFGGGALKGNAREQAEGRTRTLNIAKAFAAYGAMQEDPDKGMKTVMQNRDAKLMNDVGWNIWAGNYERYLTQYDPNGTSQGYWRQGAKDEPYGRFARGFDWKNGKNEMYFNIADRFFQDKPLSSAYPIKVRIVYLDRGTGSWALKYDAVSNPQKIALNVQKTNTGRWKEAIVTLNDAFFGNRCPHATDLMLVNTSSADTIFHIVEVTREQGTAEIKSAKTNR